MLIFKPCLLSLNKEHFFFLISIAQSTFQVIFKILFYSLLDFSCFIDMTYSLDESGFLWDILLYANEYNDY